MLVESDRRYQFPVTPVAFWDALGQVDRWPAWWPWLQSFEGDGLLPGARLQGRVRPPLPYSLDVRVDVHEAVEPRLVVARVSGDIIGTARLEVDDHPVGCEVRLTSSLGPARASLRVLTSLAPGIARFGHDWVLDNGARQFRARAL